MVRNYTPSAGSRPANQSPLRRSISPSKPGSLSRAPDGPMLSASSSNNHSLFSFGRNGVQASNDVTDKTTASFDFLPSVSFDDLQSSLESASSDFKLTQFPSPTGKGSILEAHGMVDKMPEKSNVTYSGGTTRVAIQQPQLPQQQQQKQESQPLQQQQNNASRPWRSNSILRRPSNASRTNAPSSNASVASGGATTTIMDAPTAPAAMRARRQSHYPPVSNTSIVKPPRKSVGPGVLDTEFSSRPGQRRRPSAATTAERTVPESARSSIDGGARLIFGDNRSITSSSRASKAKSMGPAPRISQATLSPDDSLLSVDSYKPQGAVPRSPRTNGAGPGKRQSIMPGGNHTSHATGLGARTISPTDYKMKRMSTKIHPPPSGGSNPVPSIPSPSVELRPNSRSPSMLPRKTSTPSSSRTTPDPNRKSFSSGLSVGSVTSFNTVRTSNGSMQRNAAQTGSRLPAPKALSIHSATSEGEEDVPPVPAIPKAYESPKESPAEPTFVDKRKSNLAFDSSSINSTSTGSLSSSFPMLEPTPKMQRRGSTRKASQSPHVTLELDKKGNVAPPTKRSQPLRLPPLNLGPLSAPTTAKIAALGSSNKNQSPPPTRQTTKTPTTPMTASKSSFFSRHRGQKPELTSQRSNSSIQRTAPIDSPLQADATSSSESIGAIGSQPLPQKSSVSPFLSSSLPKGGAEPAGFLKRTKTGNGYPGGGVALNSVSAPVQQRPFGPRAPNTFSAKPRTTKSPPPLSSPEEPQTPSSMSSLRRKLSLSWKRSASKASQHQGDKGADQPKQDSMPPPRLPVSATLNNLHHQAGTAKPPSPSPSLKSAKSTKSNVTTSYLESKRRKSSASSLNAIVAARNESWAAGKKDSTIATVPERPPISQHHSSVVQRILKTKGSQHYNAWTADLDKGDMEAEEEMKRFQSRRKETEMAAKTLDALRQRASPKGGVTPQDAKKIAMLNIFERGEIVDFKQIYFCGTQNAGKVVGDLQSTAPNFGYDDERGDYTIVKGDHLAYRYEIIDILGKGSFGQVVRCIDHKTGLLVAVKIIRNKKRFHQQALVEVNILQKLKEWDPQNKHSMVIFTDSFYFRSHLCISTELLDMNLYEFIKLNQFRGFSLKLIRRFTKQMLSSLNLLKQQKVIHCDLKPENILLRHPLHSEIKVIDFGSSCFENEKVYTYIQSRFYRSPEVILGMTYGMPIDMWSLGCILAELLTGVPIFPGENEQEQLACIMEVFGPPEKHLIEKSTRRRLFFDSMGKPRTTVSSKGRRRKPSTKTLQQVLKCDDEPFLDFLASCLRWDPDRRMKPDEAVRHPFITGARMSALPAAPGSTRVASSTSMGLGLRGNGASPIKRHNTISVPRPLPEPPAAGGGGVGLGLKTGGSGGYGGGQMRGSPHKPPLSGTGAPGAYRRVSNISAPGSTGSGVPPKRNSAGMNGAAGAGVGIGSGLPRAANRSASAKQDAGGPLSVKRLV